MGSYQQYGITVGISATFALHSELTGKAGDVSGIILSSTLNSTKNMAFPMHSTSDIDVRNYDTDGAEIQVGVFPKRCDQVTNRPYLISFMLGGACKKQTIPTAADIPFTPNGMIMSDNVQAAIEELDDEKGDNLTNTLSLDPTTMQLGISLRADTNVLSTKSWGLPSAAATYAGLMSRDDKVKLDTVEANAKDDQNASEVPFTPSGSVSATDVQGAIEELDNDIQGIGTNLGYTGAVTQGTVTSDMGSDAIIPLAGPVNAGLFSASEKAKLNSVVVNYMGVYQTKAALDTAHPTGNDGDWAIVLDPAGPAQHYSWDDNSSSWEAVDFAAITGTTNLTYTTNASGGFINSDTGTDALIPLVTT
ncbi:MAG: hypothetical protein DSY80_04155, partial [Desulfocapsa sp.]